MPRLLLKHMGATRYLASINVTHDGSIKLVLVRDGISTEGLSWKSGAISGQLQKRAREEARSKSISVHASGFVNYHFGSEGPYYVPCLLDLEQTHPIVAYRVPGVDRLDEVIGSRKDDNVIDVGDDCDEAITFKFAVMPAVLSFEPWEAGRFGVEGLYALAWGYELGDAGLIRDDVPAEAFITVRPTGGLAQQSIPEEVAYIRFRKAMYANDVVAAAAASPNSNEIAAADVQAAIAVGPGLFPPNVEGVWMLLASVPMRIAPRLNVEFEDARYRADLVDLRAGDTRLSTVRVRFRVFDVIANAYVKELVAIRRWSLDAEL